MLLLLNKSVVVCSSVLQSGLSGDGCLTLSILFEYKIRVGHFSCSELGHVTTSCSFYCCFDVMYGE